jgi:hypothetical protein
MIELGGRKELFALRPGFGQGHGRVMPYADYPAVCAALDNPSAPVFTDTHTKGRGGSVKVLSDRERFDR